MIDFDIAKTWQRIFTERIDLALAGIPQEGAPSCETAADATGCALGRWLNGAARALAELPSYAVLHAAHEDFHRICADVLRTAEVQRLPKSLLDRLHASSMAVYRALGELEKEYDARKDDLIYVSPFAPAHRQGGRGSWDDALLTGLPVIDDQHKAIFDLLDRLSAIEDTSIRSEVAAELFEELGQRLEEHFSTEEACLGHGGMPPAAIAAHVLDHQRIMEQYVDIHFAIMAGQKLRVADVLDQAYHWAIDHIVEYDLELKKYPPAGPCADKGEAPEKSAPAKR